MSVEGGFRKRAKETRAYLRSLEDLESRLLRERRGFYRAAKTVTASRAAAYLMIYNCVEFAVREAVTGIRRDAKAEGAAFTDLKPYWRNEILKAHFGKKLSNGVNHGKLLSEFSDFFPGSVSWSESEGDIPFNGNIDHTRLFGFLEDITGKKWKAPKGTLGGSDLVAIRNIRNSLAHGDESFEYIGSSSTTSDMIQIFDRVRTFMLGYIDQIERYRKAKAYLA